MKFKIGDIVTKTKGSSWTGKIVGTYSTELTHEGYAVESSSEKGSVQIYPVNALEMVPTVGQSQGRDTPKVERDKVILLLAGYCMAAYDEGTTEYECAYVAKALIEGSDLLEKFNAATEEEIK